MSIRRPTLRSRTQSGFALITSLLLLVVMSLLGVTMMNVTRLETMMAGGAREANIALQAAEAALRDAEGRLVDASDPANVKCSTLALDIDSGDGDATESAELAELGQYTASA